MLHPSIIVRNSYPETQAVIFQHDVDPEVVTRNQTISDKSTANPEIPAWGNTY